MSAIYLGGDMSFNEWLENEKIKNPNLKEVTCMVGGLGKLECYGIETLTCIYCNLTSLKTDAKNVDCGFNHLTSIDCPNVINLSCNDNSFEELYCETAISINCRYNPLKKIVCPNVRTLECSNCQLEEFEHETLLSICCNNNPLKKLVCPMANNIECNYCQLTSLTSHTAITISCNYNSLAYIDAPIAKKVECSYNQLEILCLPKAIFIFADNNCLDIIDAQLATAIKCDKNPELKYIDSPKLRNLEFDGHLLKLTTKEKEVNITGMMNVKEYLKQATSMTINHTKSSKKI